MQITFSNFLTAAFSSPKSVICLIAVIVMIFLNSIDTTPLALSTALSNRSMNVKYALLNTTISSFIGCIIFSIISVRVFEFMISFIDFKIDNEIYANIITASLISFILIGVISFLLKIKISRTYSILTSLIFSAISLNAFEAIGIRMIIFTLLAFIISVILPFVLTIIIVKIINLLFRNANRKVAEKNFKYAQIIASSIFAMASGFQNGQKFLALFLMLILFKAQKYVFPSFSMIFFVSILLLISVYINGKIAINNKDIEILKIRRHEGYCVDISSSIAILILSFFYMPISTDWVKESSLIGINNSNFMKKSNLMPLGEIMMSFLITLISSAAISFIIAKLIIFF